MTALSRVLLATLLASFIAPVASAQWIWTPETGRFINVKRLPKETPELQLEHARSLMIQGEYKEALAETGKFIRFYGDSELADQNYFLRGEIKMAQQDWVDAAQEFQTVVVNYPGSALFDDVIDKQYEIGDSLYEKGIRIQESKGRNRWYRRWWPFQPKPFKQAIEVYSMVIDNQPFTDTAAEAQYKIGLSHFAREEYVDAALEYRLVLEQYPGSEYVDDASVGLVQCYYESSLEPAYDQAPSLLTIAAIDEHKVRFPNDPVNEELVPIRSEMRERVAQQRLDTAKFYDKRQQFQSARIMYEVVTTEFPDTEAAVEAQAWLDAHPGKLRGVATFVGTAY